MNSRIIGDFWETRTAKEKTASLREKQLKKPPEEKFLGYLTGDSERKKKKNRIFL